MRRLKRLDHIAGTAFGLALSLLLPSGSATAQRLEGTGLMEGSGDLAGQMVEGIDRFLLREIARSVENRQAYWQRDMASREKYEESVGPNLGRLSKILGVVDKRVKDPVPQFISGPDRPSLVARGKEYEVHAVRWESLPGVHGEGLLLSPTGKAPVGDVIVIPDADDTPETTAGLEPGTPEPLQWARRFAEAGCRVIVPALVSRADTYSVAVNGTRPTNQPHREFVYRPAFIMGRHVIGYELQKVLAAVDWFAAAGSAERKRDARRKIAVVGYGEGGLLALYAGALDRRIDVVGVSGYFGPRQGIWQEPIYRNVFGLLREFGDAEAASLIAPRELIVEARAAPAVDGPPPARGGRSGAAPGAIVSPTLADVRDEAARARSLVGALVDDEWPRVIAPPTTEAGGPADGDLVEMSLGRMDVKPPAKSPAAASQPTVALRPTPQAGTRARRQVDEMQAFTQSLVRNGEETRAASWAQADRSSLAKWGETTAPLRRQFYEDVIGRFEQPLLPPNARTRKIFDEPKYTGFEVMLDVWPDVFASGILLVPKDLKPGERRPVVVCQHGLEGRPRDVADPAVDDPTYHRFACQLADRGFITYAPQNPYVGADRFRTLQRKLNPLGKQLYSVIIPQHQQLLNWLSSLAFVDPERIAFYGLSYGGKTAARVPPVLKQYCLSICSGDFNEFVWKTTSLTFPSSYLAVGEYEIFEWDMGNTFGYAEMVGLIAPRPFMVERGHRDGVAPDTWVAYEYAKIRTLYVDLKISARTAIEYFDGPHTIHGVETFRFLHQHLSWPEPASPPPSAVR